MINTKLKLFISLILSFVLPSFAITAPTQHQPRSISLSPFIGIHSGYKFGNLNPLPNTGDVPKIVVSMENKGISFGMSLGYMITNHFEFQGTLIYGQSKIVNDVGIGITGIPIGKVKVSDAKFFSYSTNILYNIPLKKIFALFCDWSWSSHSQT